MEFYTPNLDDFEKYTSYYKKGISLNSEMSFLATLTYADIWKIQRGFYKDLYWHKAEVFGKKVWLTPVGDWKRQGWKEILQEVCESGDTFLFLPEELKNIWQEQLGAKIEVEELRDYWDYLFDVKEQSSRAGRRFGKIRQAVNVFTKNNPDFVFSEVTPDDFEGMKALCLSWTERKLAKVNEKNFNDKIFEIEEDAKRCFTAIHYLEEVSNLFGYKITVGANLVAFIILEEIAAADVCAHFLKYDAHYRYAYDMCLSLTYSKLSEKYQTVNIWDDAGSQTLRKHKLAANPTGFIKKYTITIK